MLKPTHTLILDGFDTREMQRCWICINFAIAFGVSPMDVHVMWNDVLERIHVRVFLSPGLYRDYVMQFYSDDTEYRFWDAYAGLVTFPFQ
jgi:hypothetical protein